MTTRVKFLENALRQAQRFRFMSPRTGGGGGGGGGGVGSTVDILEYLLPNEAWSVSSHLAVAGAGGQPIYVLLAGSRIWQVKGSGGFPWDGNSFDSNYVYQSITENVYLTPTTFKMFASASWPGANGGIAWLPRYFTEGGRNAPIVTADSTYRIYTACGVYTTSSLGGPVEVEVQGPYSINFGGTLGVQSAIVQTYKWNPGYTVMEVNYYVKGYGLVQWESWALSGGVYTRQQVSAFNTVVAGGLPALDFPCGVPTITP